MNNEGGKMEEDLQAGFGETESSFEINEATKQKLAEAAGRADSIEKLIEQTDNEVRQEVEAGNPSVAYDEFEAGREAVQEVESNQ